MPPKRDLHQDRNRLRPAFQTVVALLGLLIAAGPRPAPATDHMEGELERARALHREGRLDEALALYQDVAEEAAPSEPGIAATSRNNACVVLMNRGRYREAVVECRVALEFRRTLPDETRMARTLNNLGLALQHQGSLDEAEACFLEARSKNRDLGEIQAEVVNEANLGVLHTLAGHYERALAHHEAAAKLAREHPDVEWREHQVRTALINRGVVLEKLGAYREALELYLTVLGDETELEPWQKAPLLVNKGVIFRNLGDPVQALEDFAAARKVFEASGDLSGLSNTWLNEALALHLNLERPAAAEESYRRALALAQEGGDVAEEIQDLFYLGALLRETGRLAEAKEIFEQCLEASQDADSAEGRWSSLEGLGRVAWATGRPEEALELLLEALDQIERTRSAIATGRLRSGFFGDRRSAYGVTAELLAEMFHDSANPDFAERSFLVSQRAKARDLLDAIGEGGLPLSPLTATEVREHLDHEVLLEYFVADTVVLRWEVHRNGLNLTELGPRDSLSRSVELLHSALERGSMPDPDLLEELSRSFLGGLSDRAHKAKELRIAPDGLLRYLPFELLSDPDDETRPLLVRTVVSYLPSGSALGRPASERSRDGTVLVGLANPDLGADSKNAFAVAAATAERLGLGPLPAAEREIRTAAGALPGASVLLVGEEATEAAFRAHAAEGAQVLHLASHAVLDERSDNGAAVLLRSTGDDDGMLYPAEVADLDIASRLVVLSACRTALGGPGDGRALASLTGAFLAAGSDAVVATLWEVGDETAATFSEQFYFEIARGRPAAVALAEVKRRMLADRAWSHPSLWAGWVILGNGAEPVVVPPSAGRRFAVFLAILGALTLAILVNRLRTRAGPS